MIPHLTVIRIVAQIIYGSLDDPHETAEISDELYLLSRNAKREARSIGKYAAKDFCENGIPVISFVRPKHPLDNKILGGFIGKIKSNRT